MERLLKMLEALDLSNAEMVLDFLVALLQEAKRCREGKAAGEPLEIDSRSGASYRSFIKLLVQTLQDWRITSNQASNYVKEVCRCLYPVTVQEAEADEKLAALLRLKVVQEYYEQGDTVQFEKAVQEQILSNINHPQR